MDNIVRDSRLAVTVGLFPLIGLLFFLRLVQWYQFNRDHPDLVGEESDHPDLARDFRAALPRFWFAVLFYPGIIGLIWLLLAFT